MKVLFGVFDWGLGHATRDSILIEELLKRKNRVDIISTGRALKLLQAKFGKKCKYFDVRSVHVPYPENGFFITKFTFHVPGLIYDLVQARK